MTTEAEVQKRLRSLRRSLPRNRPRSLTSSPLVRPRSPGWVRSLRAKLAVGALFLALFWVVLPPFYWPVSGPVSSGFLLRWKPDSLGLQVEVHRGIDVAAPRGTAVHPTAWGLVVGAGRTAELGNYVRVSHLFGVDTLYGHLDRIDTAVGQPVGPGLSTLGAVGSTGRSTGPHLHFGVFWARVPLPPDVLVGFHSLRRAWIGF